MRTRRQAAADSGEPPVVKKQKTTQASDAPSSKPAKVPKPKVAKKPDSPASPPPIDPSTQTPAAASPPSSVTVDQPKLVKQIRKGRAAVDSECPRASDCHVYEELGKVWTETLNQTDLRANANKYYIIQLLQSDSNSDNFYVWNRWGRVGYPGMSSMKGPIPLDNAKSQFSKKLNDKIKGGYRVIEIMYEEEDEPAPPKASGEEETKQIESKLDRRVQDFIRLIFDIKQIKSTLAEIGYDSNKMPLGKLSNRTLQQGYEILKRIEAVLDNKAMGNLETLTSEFFSTIPHDFGFKQVSQFIINSKPKMQAKVAMLEALGDMKITSSILAEGNSLLNPIDDHYQKLHCQMFPLERSDPLFSMLEMYIQNTHASTHNRYSLEVFNIFALERENEAERFRKDLDNHMLLWHGSRLTNWVGILSQGLRIAPPEAPVTGYMFGKGVYFADMVSKSANYCFTSPSNNIGCLMLCDVALGTCNEKLYADHHADQLPAGTHSTKGCGKSAPAESSYVDLDGIKVPLGKGEATIHNGSLLYNEYIVYDVAQIKMKFLFVVRFNYHQ